jgi:hypothetical protein
MTGSRIPNLAAVEVYVNDVLLDPEQSPLPTWLSLLCT